MDLIPAVPDAFDEVTTTGWLWVGRHAHHHGVFLRVVTDTVPAGNNGSKTTGQNSRRKYATRGENDLADIDVRWIREDARFGAALLGKSAQSKQMAIPSLAYVEDTNWNEETVYLERWHA